MRCWIPVSGWASNRKEDAIMSETKTLSIKEQNKSAASSLLKKNIRKFLRNKLAVFGLLVIVIMTVACVAAMIMGIDYSTPNPTIMKAAPDAAISSAPIPSAAICWPGCCTAGATPSSSACSAPCSPAYWAPCWAPSPATSAARLIWSSSASPRSSRPFPSWSWS